MYINNYVSQRVEDIEAGVESSVEVASVENLNTFSVKESETVLKVVFNWKNIMFASVITA